MARILKQKIDSLDLEAAAQLMTVTWDGDLISKSARDDLIRRFLAQRAPGGFNMLTPAGVEFLINAGVLVV